MSRASLAFPLAVGLAEGGWVAVLYLLVDSIARVNAPLNPIVFMVTAGVSCAAAARLDRLASSRLTVVVGLLVGGAAVGLFLSVVASTVLLGRDPGRAMVSDPGAILLGIAALRGFVRAGALRDAGQASRPFLVALVGLTCAWIFGGALSEPMRTVFREAAVVPTIAFVIGGLASTGLARAELASSGAGFDPLANRPWLVAMLGSAAAIGLASLPVGNGLERMFAALIAWPLTLPLLIFGAIVARILVPSRRGALRRAGIYTFAPLIAFGVLALIAVVWPHREVGSTPEEASGSGLGPAEPDSPVFDILLTALAIGLIVAVLLFLARAWRKNAGERGQPSMDRRSRAFRSADTDLDGGFDLGRQLRRLTRRGRPSDAVAAYLAALRAIEPDEELRRDPAETPAAHAKRLRGAGAGTLELDLLAADFELARWGGRWISPAEDRRAIGRWERFRIRQAGPTADG
jgi:hypothetical protein